MNKYTFISPDKSSLYLFNFTIEKSVKTARKRIYAENRPFRPLKYPVYKGQIPCLSGSNPGEMGVMVMPEKRRIKAFVRKSG